MKKFEWGQRSPVCFLTVNFSGVQKILVWIPTGFLMAVYVSLNIDSLTVKTF